MKWIVLLVGGLACLPVPASAAAPPPSGFTGGTLLALCRPRNEPFDAVCQAYISGYFAGLSAGSAMAGQRTEICIPQNLGPGDVRPIIENYLAAHPERAGVGAATSVAEALLAAYPCNPGQRPQ